MTTILLGVDSTARSEDAIASARALAPPRPPTSSSPPSFTGLRSPAHRLAKTRT